MIGGLQWGPFGGRADLYSHAGLVTFGNEATGRWAALPGTMKPQQVVDAMLRITRNKRVTK